MKFARNWRYVCAIVISGVLAAFVPSVVDAADNKLLIEKGRQLFMNETFNGNGRTCASCHPPTNNFTIDPAFIARLPDSDPLFVAEFNPALAKLEDPGLMRSSA
jgi:cytochrome c peroxidase